MKTKNIFRPSAARNSSYRMLPAFSVLVLSASSALAQLTYDANTGTTGAQDGAGAGWNTANVNFWNGSSNVVWSNGLADTAIFGAAPAGTGGTVAVGTVNVGTIQFNPQTTTGYTLSGGSITLGTGITTTSSVNSTISSVISGSNGLAFNSVLNAQNGVALSAANDYTGITILSTGGRITAGNATALGSSAGATASVLGGNHTVVNALTTIQINTSTSEAFVLNGQGSIASGNAPGALRLSNGITLSSFVQLGSDAQLSGTFGTGTLNGDLDLAGFRLAVGNGNNAISANVNGVVTGATGGFGVSLNGGTNVVNLSNAGNTYAGTTEVFGGGTIGLGGNAVLGGSTVVFSGGGVRSTDANARTVTNQVGTFTGNATFGATTTQTGELSFTNTAQSSLGNAARTFTTNVNTTFNTPFSSSGATGGIVKAGLSTLTLTGESTYAGATTVGAGTVLVNNTAGSGTGTGIVNVTTATFGGNGIIGGIAGATGAVTINNDGFAAPGDPSVALGIGTLSIGSASFNRDMVFGNGSTLSIGVSGATSDLLRVFGGLDLSGTDTLAITGTLDGFTNYQIATYTGPLTSTFNSVTGLTGGYMVDYTTPGSIFLTIPEPSTAMLGGLALLLAFRRRRSD